MSLRLNKSAPIFQTKRKILDKKPRARSRREHRLNNELSYFMIVRQQPYASKFRISFFEKKNLCEEKNQFLH